jgi:hypothetical protein
MPVLTISAASPVGVLADGTPYYAPIGEVIVDGSLVTCHLCGRSLRSVTAHLRAHGWTKLAYCEAFGLERGQSLEGPETRKLRAVALASRLAFEPAMRQGSAAGRARARTGALARDAARAATGRSMPEQRRRKAAAALAAIPPPLVARANQDRAARHLAGWTWAAMAGECAQPSSWLRRQARPGSPHQPPETMPNDLRAATWPARDPPPVAGVPLRGQPRR